MCHIGGGFQLCSSSACEHPVIPVPSVKKRLFFPHWMNLATLFKNQLTINIRIYFWILNSVPSFQVLPVLHWVDHCSYGWVLKLETWVLQLCSPLSRLLWLCRTPCISTRLSGLWHWVLWMTSCHWLEEGSQFVHLFLNRRFRLKTFLARMLQRVLVISVAWHKEAKCQVVLVLEAFRLRALA